MIFKGMFIDILALGRIDGNAFCAIWFHEIQFTILKYDIWSAKRSQDHSEMQTYPIGHDCKTCVIMTIFNEL